MDSTIKIFSIQLILVAVLTPFIHTVNKPNDLEKLATRLSAPFAKGASARLHSNKFGKGRAPRSTDCILFNKSSNRFILEESICVSGKWSTGLLPPEILDPKTSYVYGTESNGKIPEATDCTVKYYSDDGLASFNVSTRNPYFGRNSAKVESNGLRIVKVVGMGQNSQVKFFIYDFTNIGLGLSAGYS